MASGTITLSTSGKLTGRIVCSSTSNGSVANTSTFTATIQAKRTNTGYTTTGTWTGTLNIGGTIESFSIRKAVSSDWVTLHSFSVTVPHNDDGTGKCYVFGQINGPTDTTMEGTSVNGHAYIPLDTIPRASVLGTISNFTLGNAINIPITKRSSSFTDSLTISLGGTTIKTINNITNGYDVSFTSAELTTIYSKIPTATTGTFTFKLTTKSGSDTIGTSSKTATGTIPTSVKPTISSVTISEANTSVVPSSWGVYVKNKTKLKFVISASAGSGSSVSSVKTTINGSTYTGTTITTNLMNKSGSLTATISVTDKRNRTTSTTKTITIVDYDDPYVTSLSAYRCNADGTKNDSGTYARVTLVGGIYPVSGKNTPFSYVIQYKKTTDTEYQVYTFDVTTTTINNSVILSSIDGNSSYDIRAIISDYFTSTGSGLPPLLSVFRTMNYKVGGHGLGIGKTAELEGVLDIGFETRLAGGLKPVFLVAETDLNSVLNCGWYTGENISTYKYGNCPLTSGTFSLEVMSCGESGQRKQRITSCSKTDAVTYERLYYSSSWGEWVRVSDFGNALLWEGALYMQASHTITLNEAISKQANGIVLVFSQYVDGSAVDYNWHTFFIPKMLISLKSGTGHCFNMMSTNYGYIGSKYLYINDTSIGGHADNTATGTTNGVTYANNSYVLRYVIGV